MATLGTMAKNIEFFMILEQSRDPVGAEKEVMPSWGESGRAEGSAEDHGDAASGGMLRLLLALLVLAFAV